MSQCVVTQVIIVHVDGLHMQRELTLYKDSDGTTERENLHHRCLRGSCMHEVEKYK